MRTLRLSGSAGTIGSDPFGSAVRLSGIRLGATSCHELVNVLPRGDRIARDWMLTQLAGDWPSPITFAGGLRARAVPGCPRCKRCAATIVRGITQLAWRLLGANYPDSAWLLRASRGADNSGAPHSARQLAKTTARSLIRGPPSCQAYRDYWPGTTALKRPASLRVAAEP